MHNIYRYTCVCEKTTYMNTHLCVQIYTNSYPHTNMRITKMNCGCGIGDGMIITCTVLPDLQSTDEHSRHCLMC